MKTLFLLTCLVLTPLAVVAQDGANDGANDGEAVEGLSLMEEGAQMILRGLMDEMGPALDDITEFADEMEPALRSFAQELGPALSELRGMIDEVGNYQAPEILPNGDIIMRRRPDAPVYIAPEGEVEL